ncbi:uncharacterized protein KZ484_016765 [Pholidichthys leucotaenia]
MDAINRLEIYIPVEAEVKRIPLCSLSNSVLKQMGPSISRKPDSSVEGIWISPVVIRKKGQKHASSTENSVTENMASVLCTHVRATPGPLQMGFVSSNHAAYRILRNTSNYSTLPQDSAPQTNQDAIVIYRGQFYLSLRKSGQKQVHPEPCEPQLASQSTTTSTPSKRLKKVQLSGRRPRKYGTCEKPHQNGEKNMHQRQDEPSPMAANSFLQLSDAVKQVDHDEDTAGEQGSEEVAPEPYLELASSATGEWKVQDVNSEEPEISVQYDDGNSSEDVQSSTLNQKEPLDADIAPMPLQMAVDFSQLEHEEKIALLRAKLRQKQAALNSLP